ncbi:hypothetical protein JTB14_012273 [Gonioctena quinquepunctata]|nr:hypothetical protein JTB14_012273 [Gonioctena quinquepunctata]
MVYKYNAGAMQRAIEAVTNDGMAYSTAAKTFSVPRNTLKRRVLGENIDAKGNRKVLGKYRAGFTEEQEAELVRHILDLEKLITLLPNALMCLSNSLDQIKRCVKHVRLKTPYLRQLKKTWKKEAYVSKTHKIELRLSKSIYNLDHRPDPNQIHPPVHNLDHLPDPNQIHPPVHNLGPLPAHKQDFSSLYAQKISSLYQKQKLLKRKKGTAAVLTSSPYKLELEQANMEKENKEKEKEMRRVARAQKMKEKEEKGKMTTSKII